MRLLRLSEDSEVHVRFIAADADRGPFEAQKEHGLRRPAQGPLGSTERPLRPTEDLLRRADGGDGAMNPTKRILPPNVRPGGKRTF